MQSLATNEVNVMQLYFRLYICLESESLSASSCNVSRTGKGELLSHPTAHASHTKNKNPSFERGFRDISPWENAWELRELKTVIMSATLQNEECCAHLCAQSGALKTPSPSHKKAG